MARSHVTHDSKKRRFRAQEITRVPKEWGEEHWIVNKEYCGKKLILKKNRRCSMHSHKKKDEVFYIQSGKVLLEMNDEKHTLLPGDFIHIIPNTPHRFTGLLDSEIIEFSTTHDEADSYRSEFSGHADPVRFTRQSSLIAAFNKKKILVIGDVMLDRYVSGRIDRISPEAPIPVVHAVAEREVLGGAANAAANACSLGADVTLLGVIGTDHDGARITQLLKTQAVRSSLIPTPDRPTTLKERITSIGGQQIVRIDRERTDDLPSSVHTKMTSALRKALSKTDAVLIADYAKGVVTPSLLKEVLTLAAKKKIPVILDPKPHGALTLKNMRGVSLITPNVSEARALAGDNRSSVDAIGKTLSKATNGSVLLTRGADGMDLFHNGKHLLHLDSQAPQVTDVSGAGDTVAAIVALTLSARGSREDGASLGNLGASIVVQKRGTAVCTRDELLQAL